MTDAYAIIGLQYGSEAKGALAGYLARSNHPDVVMANWSPNAGHTFKDGDQKVVRRCIPIGTESPNCRYVLLGPGSIIDPEVFWQEVSEIRADQTVIVHPHAGIVLSSHRDAEKHWDEIGSTKKGAGEAAVERMSRKVIGPNIAREWIKETAQVVVDEIAYHDVIDAANLIQIEGCQGYSLSMYNGFYPYTTSRDTTIHQLLADVAWHGRLSVATYGALRTYPIRVAGTSGPAYRDQEETTWDALGVQAEITTVTKKIRRVFTFSEQQIRDSLRINNCDDTYLSFCDYPGEHEKIMEFVAKEHKPIRWVSFGPDYNDMQEVGTGGL